MAQALDDAATTIENNNKLITADLAFLDRFMIGFTVGAAVLILIGRIPLVGRALALALRIFRQLAVQRQSEGNAQKAANDAMLAVIRRAQESARRASRQAATVE